MLLQMAIVPAQQSEPVSGKNKHLCGHTSMGAINHKDYVAASYVTAEAILLNTGPVPKNVVPISHWGNKAQVKKYWNYPLTPTID